MGLAYTPGLKRKALTLVRKVRTLPISGRVLVKEGEAVSPETVIAATEIPGEPMFVSASSVLGVEPEDLPNHMLKGVGQKTVEGETIARMKYFGMFKKELKSTVTGTIEFISDITGQVIVRKEPITVDVKSHIPGTVTAIMTDFGAVVETPACFIQGIFGVGGETHGELMMLVKSPNEATTVEKITPECSGKVLVCGKSITGDAVRMALKVGANGVVMGGIASSDLSQLLNYEIGIAITGHENIGMTLVVTEGFGEVAMSDETFEYLRKFEGNLCCIDGTTQIRAGVKRPEIVIRGLA